ncbi:MAG: S41 family peptidase [Burkholderiales bacterium]
MSGGSRVRSAESNQRHVAGEYDSSDRYHLVDRLPPKIKSWPLVVLVDHGSAACSEILAAALQDHKRAKVVGHETFGYGTVQAIVPFGKNTAFKLTIGRFYRPSGGSMDSDPVVPDVAVDVPKEFRNFGAEGDLALMSARRLLEEERSR